MYHDIASGCVLTSASTVSPTQKSSENVSKVPQTKPDWKLELSAVPDKWVFTPVKDKRPLRPDWQHETAIPRDILLDLLKNGQELISAKGKPWHCHWTGIGLRLGTISGGLLAIDCDGELAEAKLQELSQGELPPTVSWTSGKAGRRQLLYQIPSEIHDKIKTIKLDCGDGQYLEYRWEGCQSVLPPSRHPETGQYHWLLSPQQQCVAAAPQWLLDYLIEKCQPHHSPPPPRIYASPPSAFQQWTEIDWAQSYLCAISSQRADDYDQWVQIGMALHSVSDNLLSDWENWSRQSSKYKPGECERKWRSFKPGGGIGIGSLAQWAKADGWRSPLQKPFAPSFFKSQSSSHRHRSETQKMTITELSQSITEAILLDPQGVKRTEALYELVRSSGSPLHYIEKLWREKEQEMELKQHYSAAIHQSLPELLKTRSERLNPQVVFPQRLAQLMEQCAQAMPGPVEGIVMTMLAAAASCVGTHAQIFIKRSANYKQPCILRTLLVGSTGQLKTPLQAIALEPLSRLEKEAVVRFQQEQKAYRQAIAQYNGQGGGGEEPEQPKRERFLLMDATPEKIIKVHAESKQGFLIHRDEWGGYVKAFNKYRNGQGDDRENDLSEYNGSMLIRDRVNDDSLFIEKSAISRTGGIQPEVLYEMMNKGEDEDGFFARWLFAAPAFPDPYKDIINDGGKESQQLQDCLYQLYKDLRSLPEREYDLDLDAKITFQEWQHQLVDAWKAESQNRLKALYFKIEAYTARLALILHLIDAVSHQQTPSSEINGETMKKAVYLAQYFLGQAKWLSTRQSMEGEGLTGFFAQIQALALRSQKELAARDVKQMVACLKNNVKASASYIRSLFKQLAEAGHGLLKGEGIHLKYQALSQPHQQTQQNLQISPPPPEPVWKMPLNPPENVDNPYLQKSTSTKTEEQERVGVQITLASGSKVQGKGCFLLTGEMEVILEDGIKLLIDPEKVDKIVDVGPIVDTLINSLETSPDKGFEQNVDLFAPSVESKAPSPPQTVELVAAIETEAIDTEIPWETYPQDIIETRQTEPKKVAEQIKDRLLQCQDQHQLNQLLVSFSQTAIDWVMEHLVEPSQRSLLQERLTLT